MRFIISVTPLLLPLLFFLLSCDVERDTFPFPESSDKEIGASVPGHRSLGEVAPLVPEPEPRKLTKIGTLDSRESPKGMPLAHPAYTDPVPLHLTVARSYVGVTEIAKNTGPEIAKFLASVGLEGAYNYCAAFVSYCLDAGGVSEPAVRSAVAQQFIRSNSIDAREVLRGQTTVKAGWVVVWKRGNTWQGHVGFADADWHGPAGTTIEANTTPGPLGDQRQGSGVWNRERTIEPGNYFRITHFTIVTYPEQ